MGWTRVADKWENGFGECHASDADVRPWQELVGSSTLLELETHHEIW